MIPTPRYANNVYYCLDDYYEKTVVTDNWSRNDNTTPKSDMSEDYSIKSDEEDMKINPSKTIFPKKAKSLKQTSKTFNLRAPTMFNTSNIKIVVYMAISDAGATGKFFLPGTPVKNIKPAEKPL